MLVIGGGYRYYGNVETHQLNLKLISSKSNIFLWSRFSLEPIGLFQGLKLFFLKLIRENEQEIHYSHC